VPPTVTVCVVVVFAVAVAVAAAAAPVPVMVLPMVAVESQGTVIVSMTIFTGWDEEVWITAAGGGGGGEDVSMGTPAICCVRVSVWMMWERRVSWGFFVSE